MRTSSVLIAFSLVVPLVVASACGTEDDGAAQCLAGELDCTCNQGLCLTGLECEANRCVVPSGNGDGGNSDSGPSDAGTGDAEAGDAAHDACAPNESSCNGSCTNLDSDALNCGACGNACGASGQQAVCVSGVCEPAPCAPPLAGLSLVPRVWADLFPNSPFGSPGQSLAYPGFPLNTQVDAQSVPDIQVLALEIVAPALNGPYDFGSFSQNLDNGQPFMFFSKCPADVNWSVGQLGCSVQGTKLSWKLAGTNPGQFRCELTPGETYYFNLAFIDRGAAQGQGLVIDRCDIEGTPPYTATCSWLGGPQAN